MSIAPQVSIAENLEQINQRIQRACDRVQRSPSEVTLMAVSKNQPPERVAEGVDLGLTLFGENRIQEAKSKIPLCPGSIRWHLIGHLQSNKCRDAVQLFDMIQSVDSIRLATELQQAAEKASRTIQILVEVNVAGEASKFGWNPDQILADLPALNGLHRLEIHGLMTLAPYTKDPEGARPFFRKLRILRDSCAQKLGTPLPVLSMGMSGDFEIAIEEGSNLVRIGTALFGTRPSLIRRDDAI